MGTLNIRKGLHLATPDQPIHEWYCIAQYAENYCHFFGRILFVGETTAAKKGFTNRRLPKGCDQDHPVIMVVPIIFGGEVTFCNLEEFNERYSKYIKVDNILEEWLSFEEEEEKLRRQHYKDVEKLCNNVIAKVNGGNVVRKPAP
jgi:hypothetical protein